ncbi:MAG: leucyl/phenylalanyl-tRNA--protein transferase [Rhodanobacter sp.]|nr:MAG: leucyl/phenylalanyl-tRNA--protein transferase [Rhodanobacter sp.]TAL91039.1 MAG: leucyl/phenylalanyl-tRNA--protein transferase [Rhodanobacter sp.]TAM38042.1 MAG: leucyl/phenylalanyl-tRNA--protein transferase [Rhodanobacter sp.]TAN25434.1 MAG: leucyl/phenylalanyl-tRNA--protein transferase [Rhodanobacter sp.]
MIRLPLLDPDAPERFPEQALALAEPNGLLAFGGDLSPPRLLAAYRRGIFPWFGESEPILWWSPDPRCVFRTEEMRPHRSLRRQLAGKHWRVTIDQAFEAVIRGCAAPRDNHSASWIVPAMIDAYVLVHQQGHAHSVETWDGERLVGGVYGIAVGKLFCGESMFSAESGGSKAALMALGRLLHEEGYPLLDAQVANHHTLGLGAIEIPRAEYLAQARQLAAQPGKIGSWANLGPTLQQP